MRREDSQSFSSLELMYSIHPTNICLIIATAYGVKSSSIIESIDFNFWIEIIRLFRMLRLNYIYPVEGGYILSFYDHGKYEAFFIKENTKNIESIETLKKVGYVSPRSVFNEVKDVLISSELDTLLSLFNIYRQRFQSSISTEERMGLDLELGKILGYPECCIKNFTRYENPTYPRYLFHKQLIKNKLDKNIPVELWAIYHTPCKYNCSKSMSIGKRYLETVKSFSRKLYDHVIRELSSIHFAWSVGHRYIDYNVIEAEVNYEKYKIAQKYLKENFEFKLVKIKRPLIYAMTNMPNYVLNIARDIIGLKWIAFKPGKGVLIQDYKTNKIYLYITENTFKDLESRELLETVFREYIVTS